MTGVRLGRGIAALGILAAIAGSIAWACAGGGYETSFEPEASSALLSPANDTRINLALLLADRHGASIADPGQMAKGIVPFDFPYKVFVQRMAPPATLDGSASHEQREAPYGLTADNDYFGYGSGNIGLCHSNRIGARQFAAALNADKEVPAGEKPALIAARETLAGACDRAAELDFALEGVTSARGQAYAHYLQGSRLFYAEDLAAAGSRFGQVRSPSSSWLAETAAYMRFRSALAEAVKASINEWGDLAEPGKRDASAIARADSLRRDYLNAYPEGRYAASAHGLGRRIAWLGGDRPSLGATYSAMVASRGARDRDFPDIGLIDEIDIKFLPAGDDPGVTDPTLLAVIDLMRLRPDGREEGQAWEYRGAKLDRAELERQRPYFKSDPDLFTYLRAAEAFYGRKQPRETLALIPDAASQRRFTYLQFSRQMLRGFALEAVKDPDVRAFWLSLLPGATQPYQREAVELAIARHDGEKGMVDRLFATDSPLRHPLIRQHLIEERAGPTLLRRLARQGATTQELEVSLYLLLAGELHHGLYADFLQDAEMVGPRRPQENEGYWSWSTGMYEPTYNDQLGPPPLHVFAAGGGADLSPCPDIRSTATSLAARPTAIRPRLCLAEFIRRNGFDQWNERYDGSGMAVRARNGFPGQPIERIQVYQGVIASPAATADDKAFALNRAVRCFAPAGFSSCGGNDIPVEQRKAWFQRLKRDYPQSVWARDLKYYW